MSEYASDRHIKYLWNIPVRLWAEITHLFVTYGVLNTRTFVHTDNVLAEIEFWVEQIKVADQIDQIVIIGWPSIESLESNQILCWIEEQNKN